MNIFDVRCQMPTYVAPVVSSLQTTCNKPAGKLKLASQRTTKTVWLIRCTNGTVFSLSSYNLHNFCFSLSFNWNEFNVVNSIFNTLAFVEQNSRELFTCLQLIFTSFESYLQVST